ncbi:Rap1a/Tai family immunity protein [Sphingobium xenophagum]|uniref:Rap1a/Tai family immunity protein n=1 Tax=Sphingobium xenophagum TaxID=121428 RepID=UPI0012FD0D2B|nr:Rap1a/Tai family immunity protein [Sphingobium xenophagum]
MRNAGSFAIMVGLLFAPPAIAQHNPSFYINGQKLHEFCEKKTASDNAFCIGYVTAIADSFEHGRSKDCIPDGVGSLIVRDVISKFLVDHPNLRHLPANTLARAALIEAYCP